MNASKRKTNTFTPFNDDMLAGQGHRKIVKKVLSDIDFFNSLHRSVVHD